MRPKAGFVVFVCPFVTAQLNEAGTLLLVRRSLGKGGFQTFFNTMFLQDLQKQDIEKEKRPV